MAELVAEDNRKCLIITALVALVIILLIIIITLSVVLTKHKSNGPSLDNIISQDAGFPNGSYIVSVGSLKPGSPSMAPLQLNATILEQYGIRIDNSSLVAETDRLSYFYVWLPAPLPPTSTTHSTKEKRSVDSTEGYFSDIGIQFGSASTLNVVPLSLDSVQDSGVSILRRLPDSSVIYQIEVRMPSEMCSGQSEGSCMMTSWKPYSMSNSGSIGDPATFTVPLPVACGSQCDSPSDSPCATTCLTCTDQQVAGADTPVTRRYKLGYKKATVRFDYETYTIPDRITVVYGSTTIFDSTCIGTEGQRTTSISYSGDTDEIRVDVEPNCLGTATGTAWYFILGCPSACDTTGASSGAVLMSNNTQVKSSGTVYITADSQMPPLVATYCEDDANVQWTLKLTPIPGKDDKRCSPQSYQMTGQEWNIYNTLRNTIQGGNAVLSWVDSKKSTGSISFAIRGTQPPTTTIKSYISQLSSLWYAVYVAMHESGFIQFDTNGVPMLEKGKKSSDKNVGYGIFQITLPPPNCAQLWSWKENVQKGVSMLTDCSSRASNYMKKQRQWSKNDTGGLIVPVPTHADSNCVFEENTGKVIEDAVAMKQYNGVSGGQYCAWQNKTNTSTGQWIFHECNKYKQPFDYVNLVCQNVPPGKNLPKKC